MTMYFANPCSVDTITAMTEGKLGLITTPDQGNKIVPGVPWVADNGCFGKGYPGDESWLAWLEALPRRADLSLCQFATAPDVVGDAAATMERSLPFMDKIRGLGYSAAFVAQDGLERMRVPWDDLDVLFIGGSTEWKLGPHALHLMEEARSLGKTPHMGRVNSFERYAYAATGVRISWREALQMRRTFSQLCDSVDGTYLTYGAKKNLPTLLRWADRIRRLVPSERTVIA